MPVCGSVSFGIYNGSRIWLLLSPEFRYAFGPRPFLAFFFSLCLDVLFCLCGGVAVAGNFVGSGNVLFIIWTAAASCMVP